MYREFSMHWLQRSVYPSRATIDGASEYASQTLQRYYADQGIRHTVTVRNTRHQNGLAERKNRSIMDKTRAGLHAVALGPDFWAEAVIDTVDKLNHLPTATTGRVPDAEF
jgi:transposase InsO family protein